MTGRRVTAIHGGDEEIDRALRAFCETFPTVPNRFLPEKLMRHADLQLLQFPEQTFVIGESSELRDMLLSRGVKAVFAGTPGKEYPQDVLCSGKLVGERFFCNPITIDPSILEYARSHGFQIVPVRQGYTGCSICEVTENALITADPSIKKAAREHSLEVLEIRPGSIQLPGYSYGFIGGCCGKYQNEIFFTGRLDSHPDGETIKTFIEERGLRVKELTRRELLDIGGIRFL